MPIIATAGHVDHGKSTLVLALTGRDPDRWAEEKERGLTIDLGFAWTRLGDKDVGLVDVPGHERFIKNMLAGMGAVDVALFVVASDEGWMPQTEEHLGVLDAVDVSHGVIALTRSDLVDEELQQLAALEVEERVAGTTLEGWPVVPVSATQGHGVDELRTALTATLDAAGEPENIGRPRLWNDRAFTIEGVGLVVTGTLVDGDIAVDERVDLWPGPVTARIRSIQTHEQSSTRASPGSRVALNLTGVERPDIARGSMLGSRTAFRTTTRVHAQLRAVRGIEDGLANRGAYHLHAGSGHWPASLQILGDAAGTAHAIVRVAEPVPLRMGDRFILREVGRRAVVGGGQVLDPQPGRGHPTDEHARMLAAALATGDSRGLDRNGMADALLLRRSFDRTVNIDLDTGGGTPHAAEHLGDIVATKTWIKHELEVLQAATERFHEQNPMRPGIPKATLASQTGHDVSIVDSLIAAPGSGLEESGPVIRTVGYHVERSEAQEVAWADAQTTLRSAGFAVPRSSSLGLDPELFHSLVRDGELIAVGDDVSYLPEQIDDITMRLNGLGNGFTVSAFRDALEVSRRQAVPLLEWLDKHGYTVRRGDLRMLGPGRAGEG